MLAIVSEILSQQINGNFRADAIGTKMGGVELADSSQISSRFSFRHY